jgi:hypothetical protein
LVGAPQRLPPATVIHIPLHRRSQADSERDAGRVPDGAKERVIQRVTAVVTFSVFDHRHHIPIGAARFQEGSGQFPVGQLDIAVDVVDTATFAVLEHELDALAVIVYVYPPADIKAIAI